MAQNKKKCPLHINCLRINNPIHQENFICDYQKICLDGLKCEKQKPYRGWSRTATDKHNRFFIHLKNSNNKSAIRHLEASNAQRAECKPIEVKKIMWKYELTGIDVFGTVYNIESSLLGESKNQVIKCIVNKHLDGNAFTEYKIVLKQNFLCFKKEIMDERIYTRNYRKISDSAPYFICETKEYCPQGFQCRERRSFNKWCQEQADQHNQLFIHGPKIEKQSLINEGQETQTIMWKYNFTGIDVYGTVYNIDSTIESLEPKDSDIFTMKNKMIKHLVNKCGHAFTNLKIILEVA